MTIATRVHEALERVEAERSRVTDTVVAIDGFARRVDAIQPAPPIELTDNRRVVGRGSVTATTGPRLRPPASRCGDVRELFAEAIHTRSIDDVGVDADRADSLQATLRDELGREIALLLSPETDRRFTPEIKDATLTVTRKRRAELKATADALSTEGDSLRSAANALETITDWLVRVDETPLPELGFDDLRERHKTLSSHRERCRRALQDRQEVLHGTTSYNAAAKVPHHSLVSSLYRNFPMSYPVVVTMCRLEDCCADCQRAVRDHLTRRV